MFMEEYEKGCFKYYLLQENVFLASCSIFINIFSKGVGQE